MALGEVFEHVLFSADIPHLSKRMGLVKIRQGCYVETDYLLSLKKPWDRERAVALARIVAYSRARKGTTAVGIAAGLLHGMNSSESIKTIDLAVPGPGRGHRETLPPIVVGTESAAPACDLALHPAGQTAGMSKQKMFGVQVLSLEHTIISAVLLNPDESGFVTACEGMRMLGRFSRPSLDISRAREARVRKALLQKLEQTNPGSRNRRRAAWLLECADGACDSVAEELLLYHLCAGGLDGVRTQYLVAHPMGKYYLDFAVPELMLGIEFDGRMKYQGPERDLVMLDQMERESELRRLGWRIVRFTWSDLRDSERIMTRLGVARAA
ncbi:MAG: DUF559 domain-containing protein [Scrofimicrobium sp.]